VNSAEPFGAGRAKAGKTPKPPRFWEIDALRGLAVIAMIAYHSFFCANYVGLSALSPYQGILGISPLFIAGTFLFVSGLSMRAAREASLARGGVPCFLRHSRRSLLIGAGALVITLVTFFAAGLESFVAFGILHCIALAGIILYPFLSRRWLTLFIGLPVVVSGFLFLHGREFPRSAWWFFIFGFRPEGYYPLDFVPLLPWLGFSFLGIFAASFLYKDGSRAFRWPFNGSSPPARFLSLLGRSSLAIYVVHIPLIMGVLLAIKFFL